MNAHGYIQAARGMCTDECAHVAIDKTLALAVEAVKNVEAERDRLRDALGELAEAAREFTTQAEYAVEEGYEDDLMGCISQAEELAHPSDPIQRSPGD